ncbi:MAG: putative selenium-dependent hydroxylase accessory protein YqeC [Chloroflexi bacterium]|nr:putative selenium-dependent hydroxylase accessory protein YqeC [Chloroflexota bacterium]
MDLKTALRLPAFPRLALVGAGGKTTALFHLARQFAPPVLVTATTHLADEQLKLADHHFFVECPEDLTPLEADLPPGVILLTGRGDGSGRSCGVGAGTLERIRTLAESRRLPLLIEADGSRQLPLKAPAPHEPPIPEFVDTVIVVAGLSALGNPLAPERVHRPERFAAISGLSTGETITPDALARVLTHPNGGLKNIPANARRVALLNQADTPEAQIQASALAGLLLPTFDAIVIASLNPGGGQQPAAGDRQPAAGGLQSAVGSQHPAVGGRQSAVVYATHEPVAGIVLAAGEASRFKQPKQLLPWRGKPLVWHVAHAALEAGLSPVVVVSGAYTRELRPALAGLPVRVLHNPRWEEGQGTSVGAGVREIPPRSGAAVFLLADQPTIPVPLLLQLVETHARARSPIVAPFVKGQRANPVLFDRDVFADLIALSGDIGGRKLFSKYPVFQVPWDDPALLLDVDTLEDYHRLVA